MKLSWKLTWAPTCPMEPDRVTTKEESVQNARESSLSPIRAAYLCISFISLVALVWVDGRNNRLNILCLKVIQASKHIGGATKVGLHLWDAYPLKLQNHLGMRRNACSGHCCSHTYRDWYIRLRAGGTFRESRKARKSLETSWHMISIGFHTGSSIPSHWVKTWFCFPSFWKSWKD